MRRESRALRCALLSIVIVGSGGRPLAQARPAAPGRADPSNVGQFVDAANGVSLQQLVQMALARNADLLATRQRSVGARAC